MTRPLTISRRTRTEREASFERLRSEGLGFVRSLSGETWTDHNLHDPGITILEQLCYGLTELVYRADFPVADQLTGPDGRIDFDALSLQRPQDVLPCRPTTAADYRRVLLDRVPGIDDATLQMKGSEAGVFQLMLKLSEGIADGEKDRIKDDARRVYLAHRNLGEDLDETIVLVQDISCELHAEIEIERPDDAAGVLAAVYNTAARYIAQVPRLRSLRDLMAQGMPLESIYDGPYTPRGLDPTRQSDRTERIVLYAADVAAEVGRIDGVIAVRSLLLSLDGKDCRGSLPWHGRRWARRLRVPTTPQFKQLVVVKHRNRTVDIAAEELRSRYEDLHAVARAALAGQTSPDAERDQTSARDEQPKSTPPRGRYRESTPYYSVQHHFPAAYGLGHYGVPRSAGPLAQAKVRQLKTYLLLFEQIIANGAAQLQHLRELFSINRGSTQSYWWQILGKDNVPGLNPDSVPGVDVSAPNAIHVDAKHLEQEVYAPFDRGAERKNRVLDHLLALHGETYTQDSMRQFLVGLSPDEAEAWLFRNKVAYLRKIVPLARDRAGGFDYGKASLGVPGNCSVLVRRVCLLLGFRYAYDRRLGRGDPPESPASKREGRRVGDDDESEGLHVVEHVLLRPLSSLHHAALVLPNDFFDLRLTIVLPSWTVRAQDRAFRQFVKETVRLNCPAHLRLDFRWRDLDAMREFEGAYGKWLMTRLAHSRSGEGVPVPQRAASARNVDQAARGVIECLQRSPEATDAEYSGQGHA